MPEPDLTALTLLPSTHEMFGHLPEDHFCSYGHGLSAYYLERFPVRCPKLKHNFWLWKLLYFKISQPLAVPHRTKTSILIKRRSRWKTPRVHRPHNLKCVNQIADRVCNKYSRSTTKMPTAYSATSGSQILAISSWLVHTHIKFEFIPIIRLANDASWHAFLMPEAITSTTGPCWTMRFRLLPSGNLT